MTNGVALATPQERLHQRLSDPHTAEILLQILDKLDVIALTVDSLDGFLRRGDEIMDNVSAGVHDLRAAVPTGSLDMQKTASVMAESLPPLLDALPQLTQTLPRLLELTHRLDNPDTAEALDKILDNLGLASFMLDSIDGFLKRSDTVIDSVADGVHEIRGLAPANEPKLLENVALALPQLAAMLPQLVNMLPQITSMLPALNDVAIRLETILTSREFEALMNSGVFAPKTVGIVGQAGNALVDSYEANQVEPKPIGLMGAFRALQDPDVQRALGFLVEFGKRFGQAIDRPS
ncbi:MAG: DUF1641 domain-containing protein [Anaerolineae bacterium]|nr:DUF1641 domain-containing protein [Anaerolineae bacterium]